MQLSRVTVSIHPRSNAVRLALAALPVELLLALPWPAQAAPKPWSPSREAPPAFGAEVRYYFRERQRGAPAGAKSVSAADHVPEALPASSVSVGKQHISRMVAGKVKHLPYYFTISLLRDTSRDPGVLRVDVADRRTHKSLKGFPKTVLEAVRRLQNRIDFVIPVTEQQKQQIGRALLSKDGFVTYVNLVIGFDITPPRSAAAR